jgi:ketosteroid isomerase-like protein
MKKPWSLLFFALLAAGWGLACVSAEEAESSTRLAELDAYWQEVSRAVREGDFAAYRATCHPEAVLVSGKSEKSYPLSQALARWQKEFDATRDGTMQADVEFRFSQRFGDPATAHETGIFRYSATTEAKETTVEYIHFVALLIKKADGWKILMEHQARPATQEEWEALAKD